MTDHEKLREAGYEVIGRVEGDAESPGLRLIVRPLPPPEPTVDVLATCPMCGKQMNRIGRDDMLSPPTITWEWECRACRRVFGIREATGPPEPTVEECAGALRVIAHDMVYDARDGVTVVPDWTEFDAAAAALIAAAERRARGGE